MMDVILTDHEKTNIHGYGTPEDNLGPSLSGSPSTGNAKCQIGENSDILVDSRTQMSISSCSSLGIVIKALDYSSIRAETSIQLSWMFGSGKGAEFS